jgi:hypothetical protein
LNEVAFAAAVFSADCGSGRKGAAMAMTGSVQDGAWSVSVQAEPAETGGYQSTIHVRHSSPDGNFEHTFRHGRKCNSERDAVLDGLREGTTWIGLKMARTIKM